MKLNKYKNKQQNDKTNIEKTAQIQFKTYKGKHKSTFLFIEITDNL